MALKIKSEIQLKTKAVPSERTEQIAVIDWWDNYAEHSGGIYQPNMLIHIPNEGQRGDVGGWLMKRQGVRAGVPDLFLAYPVGDYCGLWIEMKSVKGRATAKQKDFLYMLSDCRFATVICYGFEQARKVILSYLDKEFEAAYDEDD